MKEYKHQKIRTNVSISNYDISNVESHVITEFVEKRMVEGLMDSLLNRYGNLITSLQIEDTLRDDTIFSREFVVMKTEDFERLKTLLEKADFKVIDENGTTIRVSDLL